MRIGFAPEMIAPRGHAAHELFVVARIPAWLRVAIRGEPPYMSACLILLAPIDRPERDRNLGGLVLSANSISSFSNQ
jgi:hypothetical protein